MKKYTYHIGFVIVFVSSFSGVGSLISYLFNARNISKAYSFSYIISYVFLPASLCLIPILVLSYWDGNKSKKILIFRCLFWIHILMFGLLFLFFRSEANKLKVVIKNLSNDNLEHIKVIARDKEVFYRYSLNSKDSIIFFCDCREVQGNIEKVGINMEYEGKFGKVQYNLLSANQPIYKNQLEVLLGDTISFTNSDIEYQWIRLDKQVPAYSTED